MKRIALGHKSADSKTQMVTAGAILPLVMILCWGSAPAKEQAAEVDFGPALVSLQRLGLVRAVTASDDGEMLLEAAPLPEADRALRSYWQGLLHTPWSSDTF